MKMRTLTCPECGALYATDTRRRTCYDFRCVQAAAYREERGGPMLAEASLNWIPLGSGCRKRIDFTEADTEDIKWEEHDHGDAG